MTIDQIIKANKEAGRFFFSPATMRTWGSRVSTRVHEGPKGIFFVTSEASYDGRKRDFSVRQFLPESGEVRLDPLKTKFDRSDRAHAAAEYAAQKGVQS